MRKLYGLSVLDRQEIEYTNYEAGQVWFRKRSEEQYRACIVTDNALYLRCFGQYVKMPDHVGKPYSDNLKSRIAIGNKLAKLGRDASKLGFRYDYKINSYY